MKKRTVIFFLMIIVCFSMASCNSHNKNSNKKSVLKFTELKDSHVILKDYSGFVNDFCVDKEGNYYIVTSTKIRKFDFDNNLIFTIGQEGKGPGDLLHAKRIELLNDTTLVVLDVLNNRINYFSNKGKFQFSVYLKEHCYDFQVFTPEKVLLLLRNIRFSHNNAFPKTTYEYFRLDLFDIKNNSHTIVDSLKIKRGEFKNNPKREIIIPFNLKYYLLKLNNNYFASINSGNFNIKVFTANGKKINDIYVNESKETITQKDKNIYWTKLGNIKFFQKAGKNYFNMIKNDTKFPEYKPFFTRIFTFSNYFLYKKSNDLNLIDVINKNGERIGEFHFPIEISHNLIRFTDNQMFSLHNVPNTDSVSINKYSIEIY